MLPALKEFPLIVVLVLAGCAAMVLPMLHAIWLEDWLTARTFFYTGLFFAIVAVMVGLATSARRTREGPVNQIFNLLTAYAVLPAVLAAPVEHLVPSITYGQAYFEMLSSLTTTGATVFDDPGHLAQPLHLWRGLVAWLGGLLTLVSAIAILEPMQLGGFEVEAAISPRQRAQGGRRVAARGAGTRARLVDSARLIAPVYAGLTGLLALALIAAGDRGLVALVHAMSVLSTSGITPLKDFASAPSGHLGEALVFLFLLVALSRRPTSFLLRGERRRHALLDPEYRLALSCVLGISVLLFLRHFIGAYEISDQEDVSGAATALWGSLFNTLSFLSTTGFYSQDWVNARGWSGLETPGMILLALCMLGGGIATTTGGVKLLRVYALYKHGVREIQRLIHPNSVGGAGMTARRIRREGAQIAWVFLVLFLMGIAAVMLGLTALGQSFEDALPLSVAALSNTGPAATLLDRSFSYATLDGAARAVLCAAMIFGRLEALVLVSLFNPDYWRQ